MTCDFPSIRDPLDEAMRTRFMCLVNNEAIFKALFKVKDSELTFAKAISTAVETEDAARVAKETVYGAKQTPVHKIQATKKKPSPANPNPSSKFGIQRKRDFPNGTCPRLPGAARQNILQRTVLSRPVPVTSVRNWDILRVRVSRREEVPSQ